jgi:hypothetical protein
VRSRIRYRRGILKAVSAREILKGVSESEEGVMGAVAGVLKIPVPEGRGFLLAGRRLVIPRRRGPAAEGYIFP